MTAPIEDAYDALGAAIAGALVTSGFIATVDKLEIDPPGVFEPSGAETIVVTAAALLNLRTRPADTFLGGPSPRYAVERDVRLELAVAGPDKDMRKTKMAAALAAVAALVESDPKLGGTAERFALTDSEDADLPPNGIKTLPTFTIRVRSSDPLGMSA